MIGRVPYKDNNERVLKHASPIGSDRVTSRGHFLKNAYLPRFQQDELLGQLYSHRMSAVEPSPEHAHYNTLEART